MRSAPIKETLNLRYDGLDYLNLKFPVNFSRS